MTLIPVHKYIDGIRSVICHVKVSPIDSVIVKTYIWYQHYKTRQIFSTRNGKRVYLQNIIKEPEKGRWIHLNGNKLDFRRENLVQVNTCIQTIKYKETTSKHVGVCYVKSRDRWKVTLSNKLIGYFKTEDEAVHARLKALVTNNTMIKFIKEGTDPDGPHKMHVPSSYTEYGKPDSYFDLDDVEMQPMIYSHTVLGSDTLKYKDLDSWVAIPPPSEFLIKPNSIPLDDHVL